MRTYRTPKNLKISHTLDAITYTSLEAVTAMEEFDGNRSLAVRRLIREGAERRGITVDGKPTAEQAGEVQDERATA